MINQWDISVIIISSNNPYITLCIDTVYDQMSEMDELIIVDDHSSSDIIQKLEKYQRINNIELIHSGRKGNRSYNRNIGGHKSTKQILFFIDGDMILDMYALEELRRAHMNRSEIAFIGSTHASRFSEYPLALYSGITSYVNEVEDYESRKQIFENPLFKDKRSSFFKEDKNRNFFWLHYFTAFCSVEKKYFEIVKGFDENFEKWGAEDVDFGYRISQQGAIGFLPYFRGIHIPHKRDLISCEFDNYSNICMMLEKYKVWEFEVLARYKASPNLFENIFMMISRMRLISLNPIDIEPCKNTIYIDTISAEYPKGNISYYLDEKEKETVSFIGLKLGFNSQTFTNAFISDNIFVYPQVIACGVLQEAFRISKNVYICQSGNKIRIDWGNEFNISLFRPQFRLHYNSMDIMDFTFVEEETKLKVLSKTLSITQTVNSIPKLPDMETLAAFTEKNKIFGYSYCVIDLVNDSGTQSVISLLEREAGIFISGHYRVYLYKQKNIREHLLNEIKNFKLPLIFLVENSETHKGTAFYEEFKKRNHDKDILIDLTGNISTIVY